jgi:hypothetical protein
VEEAMKESVAVAAKGRRFVDHVRARLDFSKDSESSGSRAAIGAAQGGWRSAAEELREELGEGPREQLEEDDGEERGPDGNHGVRGTAERDATEAREEAPRYLMELMRNWGQMRANDDGWPVFDGELSAIYVVSLDVVEHRSVLQESLDYGGQHLSHCLCSHDW